MTLRRARLLGALLRSRTDARVHRALSRLSLPGWIALVAAADEELLSPELATPLAQTTLADLVPEEVVAHLWELKSLNAERNARIEAQLAEMLPVLAAAGLRSLLLKGARELAEAGEGGVARVMVDLDLLCPRDEVRRAVTVLESLGYRQVHGMEEAGSHAVCYLVRDGEPAMVDLHESVLTLPHLLPAAAMLSRARPARAWGASVLLPDPVDEIFYAVLHEIVHHQGLRRGELSVRRLHGIAARLPCLSAGDWSTLRTRAAQAQVLLPFAVTLRLITLVFGRNAVPAEGRILLRIGWTGDALAIVAVGRIVLNGWQLIPKPLNLAWSRATEAFASFNHRPDQDGPLLLWRLKRVGWGFDRLLSQRNRKR